MTLVFVVNSGSSSIKYRIVDPETGESQASGLIDRIGQPGGDAPDHTAGMATILNSIDTGLDIAAVGHRVVHGGDRFERATLVTDELLREIDELSPLAPLHNPANLMGIRAARVAMPHVPHVVVFDTAFHQTMPPEAYTYAIDAELAAEYGVRKYGFHGTSVKYVTELAAGELDMPSSKCNLIVLHLGNGASVTAIHGGRSVDTSMGLTPLQGLVMGTRSGDIDAAVVGHLHRVAGMSIDEIDRALTVNGGLLGLAGSADMRDIEAAIGRGDAAAANALAVWRHRVRSYIGSYTALLGRVDALVFTAGIGENSALLREVAVQGLEHLGIELDDAINARSGNGIRDIATESSPTRIFVIPTNEEHEIARQAVALLH